MRESQFFRDTVKPDLTREFPGILIIKQDSLASFQGVPDYLLLYKNRWAALETKQSKGAKRQPNQPHYIEVTNDMSYGAFAYPGNWNEVLADLKRVFA